MRVGCSRPRLSRCARRIGASGVAAVERSRYSRSKNGSRSVTGKASARPTGELTGRKRRGLELALDGLPRALERIGVGVGANPNRTAADNPAASERQADLGTVPVVEDDAVARRDSEQIDRAAGHRRQPHDAFARNTRDLRDVGSQRDGSTLRKRCQHLAESADPAFAGEFGSMVAGAPNGADTEMLRRDSIDLTVTMTRDQHLENMGAAHIA